MYAKWEVRSVLWHQYSGGVNLSGVRTSPLCAELCRLLVSGIGEPENTWFVCSCGILGRLCSVSITCRSDTLSLDQGMHFRCYSHQDNSSILLDMCSQVAHNALSTCILLLVHTLSCYEGCDPQTWFTLCILSIVNNARVMVWWPCVYTFSPYPDLPPTGSSSSECIIMHAFPHNCH